MDFDDIDADEDEFDYVHDQNDDLEHNFALAQQYLLEDEEMEEFQIYHAVKVTHLEPCVPKHTQLNDNVMNTTQTTKAVPITSSLSSCFGASEPELMYHSPEKETPTQSIKFPGPKSIPSPCRPPIQPPQSQPIPSTRPPSSQLPEPKMIPSPRSPPTQLPEPQSIPSIHSRKPHSLPSTSPPPSQLPVPQSIPSLKSSKPQSILSTRRPPTQLPQPQSIPSRCPPSIQLPEPNLITSPSQLPVPQSIPSLKSSKPQSILSTRPPPTQLPQPQSIPSRRPPSIQLPEPNLIPSTRPPTIQLPEPKSIPTRPPTIQLPEPKSIPTRPPTIQLPEPKSIPTRPPTIQLPEPKSIPSTRPRPIKLPETQSIPSPRQRPIQLPETQSIPSPRQRPIQLPQRQSIQSPLQRPINLPEPQSIQSPRQLPIKLPEPQSISSPRPRQIQLPQRQSIPSPRQRLIQLPQPQSTLSPPPPPIQSFEAHSTPSSPQPPIQSLEPPSILSPATPPIQSPKLQSILLSPPIQTLEQKIICLLKTVPVLNIPLHFGFGRNRKENLASDGNAIVEVFYTHKSKDSGTHVTLKSAEDIHDYLRQHKIPIPISFFTLERDIDAGYLYDQPFWAEMIHKEDLSEGSEKVPIPVICAEKSVPGKLAKYATENIPSKNLKVEKIDDVDDGFLLCCDCENDCIDKMNCRCFLKTLDNCSKKTRELEGDENIGYKYQRLEKPQISGIFECNRKCKCRTDTCMNRATQYGLVCKLQLFMTDLKGWGVRTLCDIPKGTYITNYVGEIVSGEHADEATRKWDDGKWKYLSILEVTHDLKEGYESDVVEPEPEDPPSPLLESVGSTETVAPCLSNEEWSMFLSQEDDCGSPPEPDYFHRPASPATSCFITGSGFFDDDEEIESNEMTQTSATEASESEFPKVIRRRKRRVLGHSKADRVLRSDGEFKETPKEFENLITGRFEFRQRSLADNNYIELANKRLRKLRECVASKKFQKQRKIKLVLLDEFNKPNQVEEIKKRREREFRKRTDSLKRSSRLSAQYVSEKVLPSVKQQRKENNSMEVATSPRASSFAFVVPSGPPRPCKLNSFSATKQPNRGVSLGKGIKRAAGMKKNILPKARKGWSAARRRKAGDSKKSFKKNKKYAAKSKSVFPEDHPLLQLNFNIDGIDIGNIGRYFNHSCNPNVFPQYVFTNSHDLRFPNISFFAKRNIKAGEELTWDYGYGFEECDEDEVKEDGSGQKNKSQEQGAGSENGDAQKDQKTDKNDDRCVMRMSVKALSSHKRLHTSLMRKLVRMKTASGTKNKRKPFKRPKTRLPCYCGQDNCIGRIC